MLVEGMSIRAISRVSGVAFNTVTKLMTDAADAAGAHHGEHTRGIRGRRHIQCDEIWSFVHCKQARVKVAKAPPPEAGDVWTFTALDTASKLTVSYLVGPRDSATALSFMDDLRGRIEERPQLSTDGLRAYRGIAESRSQWRESSSWTRTIREAYELDIPSGRVSRDQVLIAFRWFFLAHV